MYPSLRRGCAQGRIELNSPLPHRNRQTRPRRREAADFEWRSCHAVATIFDHSGRLRCACRMRIVTGESGRGVRGAAMQCGVDGRSGTCRAEAQCGRDLGPSAALGQMHEDDAAALMQASGRNAPESPPEKSFDDFRLRSPCFSSPQAPCSGNGLGMKIPEPFLFELPARRGGRLAWCDVYA